MYDASTTTQTCGPDAPGSGAPLRQAAAPHGAGTQTAHDAVSWRWYAHMLDEIDYGMLLVAQDGALLHANRTGRAELARGAPLAVERDRIVPMAREDAVVWRTALAAAASKRRRGMVALGRGEHRLWAAFAPLASDADAASGAVSVVLSRPAVCPEISTYAFARLHRLTAAESQVLADLCEGTSPADIARKNGVAVSTVRTQISSIRAKTRMLSIGSLVREVALLPPLVNVGLLPAAA